MMELVIHSPKFGKHTVLYDNEDHELISQHTWCVLKDYNKFYANTRIRLIKGNSRQKQILMHRLLLNFPNSDIDHEDGNGLNNQRNNLRESTKSQNARNRIIIHPKTSKYKGVYWNKKDKAFVARIYVNGKRIYLGYFKKENMAATAYNEAAKKYFGEFACLNKP